VLSNKGEPQNKCEHCNSAREEYAPHHAHTCTDFTQEYHFFSQARRVFKYIFVVPTELVLAREKLETQRK